MYSLKKTRFFVISLRKALSKPVFPTPLSKHAPLGPQKYLLEVCFSLILARSPHCRQYSKGLLLASCIFFARHLPTNQTKRQSARRQFRQIPGKQAALTKNVGLSVEMKITHILARA